MVDLRALLRDSFTARGAATRTRDTERELTSAAPESYAASMAAAPGEVQYADIPGSIGTTATIAIGGSKIGQLEVAGDKDWYKITLAAGDSITISLDGTGVSPVGDPLLRLRDSAGVLITENDDGGPGLNSRIVFTAETAGTYYIDVGAFNSTDDTTEVGQYTLSVAETAPLPVFTYDQIATQLTTDYWGGTQRSFNVGADNAITVNVTALTAEGRNLALRALEMWTDLTGIQFTRTSGAAEITFDDDEDGAFASSTRSGTTIVSSIVNVSTAWIADYGPGIGTYSFQTYIHEIGHALGLGHAGDYNGDAGYPVDARFANDAWATSVMSYFSQLDNSYFADQGFTQALLTTPMIADLVAIGRLYGLSTTTRATDTVYGFGSTAGRAVFDATTNDGTAYMVYDSGGIDTFNYSGFADNQSINLNAEVFNNIGGEVGNVVIARGTVIENATGGAGNDALTGNAVANRLLGGAGVDTILGNDGNDIIYGDIGNDSVGGGRHNDLIYGGVGDDNLRGDAQNDTLYGDDGNDRVNGGSGNDILHGGLGNDIVLGGSGADSLAGRQGLDTLTGNGGADDFLFSYWGSAHIDTVTDFTAGLDEIGLDRGRFTALPTDLLAGAFRIGTAAQDADDRIIYNSTTGQLLYDADGLGGGAAVAFANIGAGKVLTIDDFFVF